MSSDLCTTTWEGLLLEENHPSGIQISYVQMAPQSSAGGRHYYVKSMFRDLTTGVRNAAEVIGWETRVDPNFDPCRVALLLMDEKLTAAQIEEAVFTAGRAGVGVEAYGVEAMEHLDRLTAQWGESINEVEA